jgi:hypothetical protein
MPDVPAQVIVKLPYADLMLQFPMWRHRPKYKHHK